VSELKAEQTGGTSAPLSARPAASGSADAASKTVTASAPARTLASVSADAASLAPKRGRERLGLFAPKADAAKPQTIKPETVKPETVKPETVKPETVKPETVKTETVKPETVKPETVKPETVKPEIIKPEPVKADVPRAPDKVTITPSDAPSGAAKAAEPVVVSGPSKAVSGERRRSSALTVVVVLATVSGALGGALATVGVRHFVGHDAGNPDNSTLEASVVQMDADIQELKASVEQNAKLGLSTGDRLDLVEKAQAELRARPANSSEAMDTVRAATPVLPATSSVRETTVGAVPMSAPPASAPKVGQAKLPTLQGWVVRDVTNGAALIQGPQRTYEVFAGDPVPGLGRVDAIRRQDGHWVVVTTKGLIVGR
jgi:hypothetical protein